MTTVFRWGVDVNGYDLSPDRKRILRRGGDLKAYSPGEAEPPPHFLLANLRGQILENGAAPPRRGRATRILLGEPPFWAERFSSPEDALLGFTRRYGFLGGMDHGADAAGEPVEYLADQQSRLSLYYDFGRQGSLKKQIDTFNKWATTPATIRLEHVDGGARVRAVPQHLLSWMWTRSAEELSSGVAWTYCRWCSQPFPRGGGRLRADAEYCSPNCRAMFNRAKANAAKREGTDR